MDNQQLEALRHSCAHLLAAAVIDLYPQTKVTLGPAIENGFYYDFDFGNVKISDTDLPKIEKRMHDMAKKWEKFSEKEVSPEEAKRIFAGNEYKLELIDGIVQRKEKITLYKSGEFEDLCRGGHVEEPKKALQHFKLLSVAGAYWRGNEKNPMLTRIYGTCFATKNELQEYLTRIEEAKKRDHRRIAAEMDLYTISPEVGQGLTLWLANGAIIRKQIEDYMVSEQIKLGFKHVYSPHIGLKSLWEKSGHWDLYREKMYSPMDVDGQEYLVKPMTCPMHIQSFTHKPLSYRNLPYRIAEVASVYRYEQSGELNGLLRVRAFTQDDAHIFCTPEQAVDEFLSVFTFIQKLYAVFGFNDYRVRLGIRSSKEKYLGSDSLWEKAQEKAIEALKKVGADYFISEGDAAFYGPKADFLVKDALGREWQCGTVQIDFMLPERFNLKYTDHEGKEQTPVMIHRAPLGSLERFFAILIEQYAGKFPLWLAPQQVAILPISDKHLEYAQKVENELITAGIRAETNKDPERIGKKIRIATLQKVPYMIIIGDKEAESQKLKAESMQVSVRTREGQDLGTQELLPFINTLKTTIENHS
jgi:threonyl-tRNA synthetase